MRAAIEARRDPNLMICGRTSAASITSIGDAIVRAKAYAGGASMPSFWSESRRADLDA